MVAAFFEAGILLRIPQPLYYGIYQLLSWLFFTVSLPFLLVGIFFLRHWRIGLSQRLGFLAETHAPKTSKVRIWLHAASVGEVQLAKALVNEFVKAVPEADFVVSTMTVQGLEMAEKRLGPGVRCIIAPLDLPGMVDRVIRIMRPSLYICLETELWPNMIRALARHKVGMVLLNGRLSERSYKRYLLARGFMKRVLAHFTRISVIGPGDAERYIGLGADPAKVVVSGNAKYDLAVADMSPESALQYRKMLGLADGRPLLVAGSTHTGEEALLLKVFQDLRKDDLLNDLIWVVAPRHLKRLAEVENLLAGAGVACERLSTIRKSGSRTTDVVLVDTLGELSGLYAVATYVFCGGSLVERGGHNIMEAAVHGKPVFYGPSMKDFADAVGLLESVQAGFKVADSVELIDRIRDLARNPAEYAAVCRRTREIAASQLGSAVRQARLALDLLPAGLVKKGGQEWN